MSLLSSFYCMSSYLCDITEPSLTRFGECFQWGYWTRPRSAEGCFAAPGVRVSHSPAFAFSALIDNACDRDILMVLRGRVRNASICRAAIESPPFLFLTNPSLGAIIEVLLRRAQYTFLGGEKSPPFCFCTTSLLLRWFRFPLFSVCSVSPWRIVFCGDEAVLRGFFAVEDGAAGAADGDAVLDFFRADGAIGQRPSVVEPGLLEPELARGTALQVGDEHGIFRALPFEIGGSHQAALKFLEPAARFGELALRGRVACGDKNAVITSLPRIAVDFARDVFGDFTRGDAKFHGALVAQVHDAETSMNRRNGESFAGLRRRDGQRAEISALPRRPFFRGNVHQGYGLGLSLRLRAHNNTSFQFRFLRSVRNTNFVTACGTALRRWRQ